MTSLAVIRGGAVNDSAMPPHEPETEAAVIAACVLDETALPKLDFLQPEHFYLGSHRRMFAAARALRLAGTPIDAVTLASSLRSEGRLAEIGGSGALAETLSGVPAITNVTAYGERVYELARQRSIVLAAQRIAALGYEPIRDVQSYAEQSAATLATLSREGLFRHPESNLTTIKARLKALLDHQQAGHGRKMGLPLGMGRLDELLAGLHGGQKVTVCALPGRGKTAFLLNVARANAKIGVGSAIWVTEMDRGECLERLVAAEASVDGQKLRTGELTMGQWERVFAATEVVGRWPIAIFADPNAHVGTIAVGARRLAEGEMQARYGAPLGLVGVDYVQRLAPAPELRRDARKYDVVSHATKALKNLAKELSLPVLELAQEKSKELDRVTGVRPKPDTGDTADSKEIGKEADVLVFLRRKPRMRNGKAIGESDREITAIVDKQRGGPSGEIDLIFETEHQRFKEADRPTQGYDGGRWGDGD
jgi:replicative DNA helicase